MRKGPNSHRWDEVGRGPARVFFWLGFAAATLPFTAQAQEQRRWEAGAYSFSDELGGFTILSAAGSGTRADPIVIAQELDSSTPVTLVIRTTRPIRPFQFSKDVANGFLHLRLDIRNGSGQAWVEFEFELQEVLKRASVFGDGLSFDQRREDAHHISADSFLSFSRDFEPYDRLLFRQGKVDPGATASFGFLITDFTPRWEFFLVEDPRIPSS